MLYLEHRTSYIYIYMLNTKQSKPVRDKEIREAVSSAGIFSIGSLFIHASKVLSSDFFHV